MKFLNAKVSKVSDSAFQTNLKHPYGVAHLMISSLCVRHA